MSKKAGQTQRKKGKDKAKNTFNKYGKNTARGVRIKQAELQKQNANIKKQVKEGNLPRTYGKNKNYTGQVDGKGTKKMCKKNGGK